LTGPLGVTAKQGNTNVELLTTTRIERLACEPGQRDRLVFDSKQRGLAVRMETPAMQGILAGPCRMMRVVTGEIN
jgi:hypothetical protein